MISQKEENQTVLPCPGPQQLCSRLHVGWKPPPFQTWSQGLWGNNPVGSLAGGGTEVHSHPQGKLRQKGKPTSPPWSHPSKSNPKTKRKDSLRPSPALLTKSLILASILAKPKQNKNQIKWWFSIDVHIHIAQGTTGTQRGQIQVLISADKAKYLESFS